VFAQRNLAGAEHFDPFRAPWSDVRDTNAATVDRHRTMIPEAEKTIAEGAANSEEVAERIDVAFDRTLPWRDSPGGFALVPRLSNPRQKPGNRQQFRAKRREREIHVNA
jgi:hypothetical protein